MVKGVFRPLGAASESIHEAVVAAPLLLESVVQRVNAGTAEVLRVDALTVEQWRVLDCLVRRGEMPMTGLAGAVLIPAPTVTRIVDKLVSLALVYRSSAMSDRRRVLVHASRRGEDLHERLAPLVIQVQAAAFEGLSGDQLDAFFGLLRLIDTRGAAERLR